MMVHVCMCRVCLKLFYLCREKEGKFGEELVIMAATQMTGLQFWQTYRAFAPELAKVARLVLGTTTTTCAAERNWSDYDFIHNKRRNRLTPERWVLSNVKFSQPLFIVAVVTCLLVHIYLHVLCEN